MRNGHEILDAITTTTWINIDTIHSQTMQTIVANSTMQRKKSNARMTIRTHCYLNHSHFDSI